MNSAGLHYEVHAGAGPPLLLVHGMLASRAQWLPNLSALAAVCRPVVVELLGHGRSPAPEDPTAYRPTSYVAAFERIRRELGADRWLICGQSLGAALTLRYALDHPDRVIAQVFTNSNSALADDAWADAVRPALEGQARRLATHGVAALEAMPIHPRHARRIPAEVKAELVADCEIHSPRGVALTGLETVPDSSVRKRVGELRIPTLLVVGEREARFEPQRRFAEQSLPGLQVVPVDAGHAVNIEVAETFNSAVAAFLMRARSFAAL